MNKAILATILMSTFVSSVATAAKSTADYEKLKKEVGIMKNIIKATAAEGHSSIRLKNIESQYLINQGIVFTLSPRMGKVRYEGALFNHGPAAPIAPMAPIAPIADISEFGDIDVEALSELAESAAIASMDAYGHAMEAFSERRDYSRELRNAKRELEYELRAVEREKRDLEFEKRHADKAEKKELESRLKELKSHRDRLASKEQELAVRHKEVETKMLAKQKKDKESQQQKQKQMFASIEQVIADTLCDYGNGLRSLPKNEHVSFVVKNIGVSKYRKMQDKVYVINNEDIKKCVRDDLAKSELLSSATSYIY